MAQAKVAIFPDPVRQSYDAAMPNLKDVLKFSSKVLQTVGEIEGFGTAKVAANGFSTLVVVIDPKMQELDKETQACARIILSSKIHERWIFSKTRIVTIDRGLEKQ